MNVCETRMRKERDVREPYPLTDLPHEPKSEYRYMLELTPPLQKKFAEFKLGDYAECKHCGSIYAVEK